MSSKVLNRRRARMEPGFNLTPMLDMIFYLLFFFIMATKMRDDNERQMAVRLPAAAGAVATEIKKEAAPSITLGPDGKIFFKSRSMVKEELDLELRHLLGKGQTEIAIRGDERVNYGRVVEVMGWCKLAGMKSVMLDLRPAPVKKLVP